MSDKEHVLSQIFDKRVIAIIRADSSERIMAIMEALEKGGIDLIEITMTTPDALRSIKEVKAGWGDRIIIGAGTVMSAGSAEDCISAGAEFIVSPHFKPEIVRMGKRYSKVVIPGAMTPTEIVSAWEEGADLVKVFPVGQLGPAYIKSLRGPLPQIPLVPTGGVNLNNAADFLKAGASALGIGGGLIEGDIIEEGKFELLTEKAGQLVDIISTVK